MNLAQIVQSHALSFFHLSSPDLLLGFDAEPAGRQPVRRARSQPAAGPRRHRGCASSASRSSSRSGGKRIHPAVGRSRAASAAPLAAETRDQILAGAPRGPGRHPSGRSTGTRRRCGAIEEEATRVRRLPLGVHGPGRPGRHRRALRRHACGSSTPTAAVLAERRRPPAATGTTSARRSSPGRTSSRPTGRPLGYPDGVYRVGPLARLNVADQMGTPRADAGAGRVPRRGSAAPPASSFHYHYARLIEILRCLERIEAAARATRTSSRPGCAPDGRHQPRGGHRRRRGAARHAVPPLPGRRRRHRPVGQPGHRHRPQQPGHEPERRPGRQALRQGREAHRADAQPGRGGHPLLSTRA